MLTDEVGAIFLILGFYLTLLVIENFIGKLILLTVYVFTNTGDSSLEGDVGIDCSFFLVHLIG